MSDPLDETFNFISKIDLLNLGSLIELRIKETLSTNVQVSFTKERYRNEFSSYDMNHMIHILSKKHARTLGYS